MQELHIDIETYSSENLTRCGVYRYAQSGDFQILLFGYAADEEPVQVIDLAQGETIPARILEAIQSTEVIKIAHNANFERVCLSRFLGLPTGSYLPPESWRDTMIEAAALGLPMSLADAGEVLGLEKKKLEEGRELVSLFCTSSVSCAEQQLNRVLPKYRPEEWERFKRYNERDVEVERQIHKRLSRYPAPDFLWQEWFVDQRINDRGVAIDRILVKNALILQKQVSSKLLQRMKALTGLDNPNSVKQLTAWLQKQGVPVDNLSRENILALLSVTEGNPHEVLQLRLLTARSSVKKYQAMEDAVCEDRRLRGCFQFFGASRTGRFSGKLVQLQNLPQNHLPELEIARTLVKNGDFEELQERFENLPDVLSQLIRTAFIPEPGYHFLQADYSAIEARVLAWYAGETWRSKVFEDGGDIYCASASQMFHVPVEKNGINGELRQKGKIAELALGYGGSVGALRAMGALTMGIKEEELQPLVDAWRTANPRITRFWWGVHNAAVKAIQEKTTVQFRNLSFSYRSGALFLRLPSGRNLVYCRPRIESNRFGGSGITFEGVNSTTHRWERMETHGPKLVENIVQATSRDLLCYAMRQLKEERICMHIHDELVLESTGTPEELCRIMSGTPDWAPGLVLRAEGTEMNFFRKA